MQASAAAPRQRRHFSMIRGFHLADFFTLGNAACGAFWMATPNACSGGFVATLNYNLTDMFK